LDGNLVLGRTAIANVDDTRGRSPKGGDSRRIAGDTRSQLTGMNVAATAQTRVRAIIAIASLVLR